MTLTKKVNGQTVVLTAQEEAQILLEWQANRDAADAEFILSSHLTKRRKEYPPIEEQLEAIFAAISQIKAEGTTFLPIVEDWLTTIDTINLQYPPEMAP